MLSIVGVLAGLWIIGSIGTDKKAGTASSTTAASQAPAAAGSVVTDGKFAFQVLDMRRATVGGNPSNQFMRVNAQGVFIILTVAVQNVAGEPQSYFGQNQKLIDTAGREYETTSVADMYANSAIGDINPGNSMRVVMTFDVPVSTVASELEVHDSMFSRGTRVAIDDPRAG